MAEKESKSQGRPAKNIVKLIKDSPENIAKPIVQSPPKKQWKYI